MSDLDSQIAELRKTHLGLDVVDVGSDGSRIVAGQLSFRASIDELPLISDAFCISMHIQGAYSKTLPSVFETGEKIDPQYKHRFQDKSLCLGVPIEQRLKFCQEPSLLGFVNNLVIPYLYGYCYSRKYGKHPFGERSHGGGIVEYLVEALQLKNELDVLAVVEYFRTYGFNARKRCPCKSGRRVRHCHAEILRELHNSCTWEELQSDLNRAEEYCSRLKGRR